MENILDKNSSHFIVFLCFSKKDNYYLANQAIVGRIINLSLYPFFIYVSNNNIKKIDFISF